MFAPGQVVKCVNTNSPLLDVGTLYRISGPMNASATDNILYTVSSMSGDTIKNNSGKPAGWLAKRFVPVKSLALAYIEGVLGCLSNDSKPI